MWGMGKGLTMSPHKKSACEMLQRALIVWMQAASFSYPLELPEEIAASVCGEQAMKVL